MDRQQGDAGVRLQATVVWQMKEVGVFQPKPQ